LCHFAIVKDFFSIFADVRVEEACGLLLWFDMIDRNIVIDAAQKAMEGTDLFLVDVIVGAENEIEVEVDCTERMSIDQCGDLNRKIETLLDRDKEDFSLSVYSAGVGYPFKVYRQYVKAEGKPVCVTFPDGIKLEGEMMSVEKNDEGIFFTVVYDKKEKCEGEKRPQLVRHEDRVKLLPGMEVKEIITIK